MDEQVPKVFLVDDDASIRGSLSRALGLRGYQVETYASASDFLLAHTVPPFGCLVLDYGMPDMNGLELQNVLVQNGVEVPIIFITGHGGIPESVQAMRMGALDFLEKPFKQDALIDLIEAAFESERRNRAQRLRALQARTRFGTLTDREREVMKLMVLQPANASSKEIGRTLDISPRTVDHHRARILEKMTVGSVAELVEVAMSAGIFDARRTN